MIPFLSHYENHRQKENEIKSIPGVVEVGLFTRRADAYYKANNDGSFEIICGKFVGLLMNFP